jgi:phage shock protein C
MKSLNNIESTFDTNRHFLEKSAFGVCQQVGEWMRINPATIRMYFIYLSFITFGSPLVIYLFMAFWLNIKKYITSPGAKRILGE